MTYEVTSIKALVEAAHAAMESADAAMEAAHTTMEASRAATAETTHAATPVATESLRVSRQIHRAPDKHLKR